MKIKHCKIADMVEDSQHKRELRNQAVANRKNRAFVIPHLSTYCLKVSSVPGQRPMWDNLKKSKPVCDVGSTGKALIPCREAINS